jgi:uncharacterized damage-inducible protein DinB
MINAEQYLKHYQGHRRLTRKTLAAFPADQFTTFSVGGMRPAGGIVKELLAMGGPIIKSFDTDVWGTWDEDRTPLTQADALAQWDAGTVLIDAHWPAVVKKGFDREITIFGQWPGTVRSHLLYLLDNEIHHRAQLYTYLRALGIEPPAFWER